jgi:hypothetical protein
MGGLACEDEEVYSGSILRSRGRIFLTVSTSAWNSPRWSSKKAWRSHPHDFVDDSYETCYSK